MVCDSDRFYRNFNFEVQRYFDKLSTGKKTIFSRSPVVKKRKLVHDKTAQIEDKINEQTNVILCKFVKKKLSYKHQIAGIHEMISC